jgi:hypothetical protein
MFDILQYLPAKRKQTASGWISFNAPCCTHNGESQDKRQRGGLKVADDSWSYHCFNCNFTASFLMGRNLSFKARRLLQWLNVPQDEIERVNLESLRHRSIEGIASERRQITQRLMNIQFEERDLPDFAEILTPNKSLWHKDLWSYIKKRCLPEDYPYMFQQHEHIARHGIVVPFTHDNTVVGHTTRYIDGRTPKYIQEIQPGYVFGTDLQKDSWQYAIVVEGVFDALCINGLAVLHNEINEAQSRLIRSLEKEIVVVPDHDEAGLKLIDSALEYGYSVSVPDWPADVKDVNDAVCKYGKITTLLSIMENRVSGKIKITMSRKKLERKVR